MDAYHSIAQRGATSRRSVGWSCGEQTPSKISFHHVTQQRPSINQSFLRSIPSVVRSSALRHPFKPTLSQRRGLRSVGRLSVSVTAPRPHWRWRQHQAPRWRRLGVVRWLAVLHALSLSLPQLPPVMTAATTAAYSTVDTCFYASAIQRCNRGGTGGHMRRATQW